MSAEHRFIKLRDWYFLATPRRKNVERFPVVISYASKKALSTRFGVAKKTSRVLQIELFHDLDHSLRRFTKVDPTRMNSGEGYIDPSGFEISS
jgi:hypothetical protein